MAFNVPRVYVYVCVWQRASINGCFFVDGRSLYMEEACRRQREQGCQRLAVRVSLHIRVGLNILHTKVKAYVQIHVHMHVTARTCRTVSCDGM